MAGLTSGEVVGESVCPCLEKGEVWMGAKKNE